MSVGCFQTSIGGFFKHQCVNKQLRGGHQNFFFIIEQTLTTKFPGLIEATPSLNLEVIYAYLEGRVRASTALKTPL